MVARLVREDFSFTYDAYGYMLKFRGRNLGGAGLAHRDPMSQKHQGANLALFYKQAEMEIQDLLAERGQGRFKKIIDEVIKEEANARLRLPRRKRKKTSRVR